MPDGWELGIEKAQRSALVSVVAVNYNGLHLLKQSLPSIAAQDYPLHEVTIVDNASIDNSVQYITESFPTYRCLRSKTNLHYTRAMNLGIRESRGDLLLLINNDVVLDPSFVRNMLSAARRHPDVGIFGPKILFRGTQLIQYAAGRLYRREHEVPSRLHCQMRYVHWILGAAWMIRRGVLERIGLLDEENYTGYYDETDFQMRALKRGIKMIYVPSALAWHIDSATFLAASESYAYHLTRGYVSFGIIHSSLGDIVVRVVKVLGASAIDIVTGTRSDARRDLLARGRLLALLRSLEKLPLTLKRRIQLRRALMRERGCN